MVDQNNQKKHLELGRKVAIPSGGHGQGGLQQGPFFDTLIDPDTGQGGRNVTTAEGGKALLFCTIRNLGDNNTVMGHP